MTLNLIGLVMVLSASSVTAQAEHGSPWYYVQRQAVVVGVGCDRPARRAAGGLPALAGAGRARPARVVGAARPRAGARGRHRRQRRHPLAGRGPIGIQPSELAKLALLLFVADLLGRRLHRMHDTRVTLRPVLLVTTAVAALIMAQPNLGTTIVLVAIVIALLFVAGAPWGRLVLLGARGQRRWPPRRRSPRPTAGPACSPSSTPGRTR